MIRIGNYNIEANISIYDYDELKFKVNGELVIIYKNTIGSDIKLPRSLVTKLFSLYREYESVINGKVENIDLYNELLEIGIKFELIPIKSVAGLC